MTSRLPGKKISRRGFLGWAGAGASLVGALGAWNRWRDIARLNHESHKPGASVVDNEVTSTLVHFLGSTFGVALSEADQGELQERLHYAADHDGAWSEEYSWLAAFVDSEARESGAASFVNADIDLREETVRRVFANDVDRRTQKMRAFFQIDGRKLLRMRKSTIPHLVRLYRMSGVPWRHRGYTSWPGVPDDMLAYSRKLETGQC